MPELQLPCLLEGFAAICACLGSICLKIHFLSFPCSALCGRRLTLQAVFLRLLYQPVFSRVWPMGGLSERLEGNKKEDAHLSVPQAECLEATTAHAMAQCPLDRLLWLQLQLRDFTPGLW